MTSKQYSTISKWQDKTFGKNRSVSMLIHLLEEINELLDEIGSNYNEDKKLEFADCFILLFGIAACEGMTYKDIIKCIDDKMKINYKRKWKKPDKDGVINHIS